jgi:hypothetical protein
LAADAEKLRRDGEEREQAIAVVQAIAELHETLQSTEREFLDGRLIEASGSLCELRESLGLPADWTGDRDDQKAREHQEKISPYTLLQDAWVICYSKVSQAAPPQFAYFRSKLSFGGNPKPKFGSNSLVSVLLTRLCNCCS